MSWEEILMTDAFNFIDYRGISPDKKNSGIPLLTAKNVKKGYISIDPREYINEDTFKSWMVRGLPNEGDILFTTEAPLGNAALLPSYENVAVAQRIICLQPKINLNTKYFLWYILGVKFQGELMRRSTGSTVKGIRSKELAKIKIPLPPLPVQKKIAAILDAADELRRKDKALIDKYNELTQSLFLDMFGDPVVNPKGWEENKLGDVAVITMGQSPNGDSYNDTGEGIPLLNGPTEFGAKYPTEKQWTIDPKKFCKNGDILFCVRGATAGRMNYSNKAYCIGRGLASIRSKGSISLEYIYLFLKNMYTIFQSTSNGSTFINIGKDDLSNIKIPNTPIVLQNQFAERVEAIEKQKGQAEKNLKKSEDLFNSLLQRAFQGELVK